jgi:hypothetical protein
MHEDCAWNVAGSAEIVRKHEVYEQISRKTGDPVISKVAERVPKRKF